MTDGYEGYDSALAEHDRLFPNEKITHCSCLAHARRKFTDASKASKSKSPEEAVKMIRDIYRTDNAIRPFVLGRKNWLFTGSEEGARSSCFMYTLIENAKLRGLVPYDYLRCLFEQAADLDENSDWSKLLPWNIKITP